jgi:FtsP/CotA-like multicopper oxidase with cupredoxin domain
MLTWSPDVELRVASTDGNPDLHPSPAARTITAECGSNRRLRFINMSSHARFYVWFADNREFNVVELDGVTYKRWPTRMIELASGQRVSIVLDMTSAANCKATRIVAASDPKVGHGTKRCPMVYTNPTKGVQYTFGFLDMMDGSVLRSITEKDSLNIDGDGAGGVDRFTVWADDSTPGANYHTYPSGSWLAATQQSMRNRMKLNYKVLHSDDCDDLPGLKNYRYNSNPTGDLEVYNPVALLNFHDFDLEPARSEDPWRPPRPPFGTMSKYFHYIRLDGQYTGNTRNGLAAMAENPVGVSDLKAFNPPEPHFDWRGQIGDRKTEPKFPSLFRALKQGADTNAKATFMPDNDSRARTIMFENGDTTPHWFIIQSTLGDHPMHLHGHSFQLLAVLPKSWFDQTKASQVNLYDQVISNTPSTKGYDGANPMRRDTLWIEKDLVYVIAIKPENPGIWAFQ